jgi:hypothetical protein
MTNGGKGSELDAEVALRLARYGRGRCNSNATSGPTKTTNSA